MRKQIILTLLTAIFLFMTGFAYDTSSVFFIEEGMNTVTGTPIMKPVLATSQSKGRVTILNHGRAQVVDRRKVISYEELAMMTQPNVVVNKGTSGRVFIGDSRTYEMCMDQKDIVNGYIAQPGARLAMLDEFAIPILNSWDGISEVYVLFGINDMLAWSAEGTNYARYQNFFQKTAPRWIKEGKQVYWVNVGPLDAKTWVTNATVSDFNAKMLVMCATNPNIHYLDSYQYLKKSGYTTKDGVHYNKATNAKLHEYLEKRGNIVPTATLPEYISSADDSVPALSDTASQAALQQNLQAIGTTDITNVDTSVNAPYKSAEELPSEEEIRRMIYPNVL